MKGGARIAWRLSDRLSLRAKHLQRAKSVGLHAKRHLPVNRHLRANRRGTDDSRFSYDARGRHCLDSEYTYAGAFLVS